MPKQITEGSLQDRMPKNVRTARIQILVNCALMASTVLGLCFYTSGIFTDSVAAGLNLSAAEASLSMTFFLVFLALGSLILPKIMDRIAYHLLFQAGAVLTAASTLLMAFAFGKGWLYFLTSLQGLGCSLIGLVPITTILNNWFYRRNDWITALVLAAPALTASICGPLFSASISALGWRLAYVLMAVVIVLFLAYGFMVPFTLSPEERGMKPSGIRELEAEEKVSQKSAITSLMILILIALCGAALIAVPQHFSGYAASIGTTLILAGRMLSFAMIGNIVFKLIGGIVSERTGIYTTTAGFSLIAFIASLGFLVCIYHHNDWSLLIFSFLYGSAYALAELALPLLVKRRFGRLRYMSVYSLVHGCSLLMTALAIYLVGVIYDATGSYLWVWIIACILEAAVIALIFWATDSFSRFDRIPKSSSGAFRKSAKKESAAGSASDQRQPADYVQYPVQTETGPSENESPSFYHAKEAEKQADAENADAVPAAEFNTSIESENVEDSGGYQFDVSTKPALKDTVQPDEPAAGVKEAEAEPKEITIEMKDEPAPEKGNISFRVKNREQNSQNENKPAETDDSLQPADADKKALDSGRNPDFKG